MTSSKRKSRLFTFFYTLKEPDPKAICGVENLRRALDVSCNVAIIIAVVIGKYQHIRVVFNLVPPIKIKVITLTNHKGHG